MTRIRSVRQDVSREIKRGFFVQIPAFLEYLPDIDPYAWRLYIHYLRICGESDHCFEYTSTTARLCSMSDRTIRYRRQALADLNLIIFWYQGEKGDERVHIVIRDVWEINARFLRMITNSTIGDWAEEWIRSELSKLPSIGENALSEGKQPPAPNAYPPAQGATPPASNAHGSAPNAYPPAQGADIERSLRKIPYTDPNTESERARASTPTPPPATPANGNRKMANDEYEHPLTANPSPSVPAVSPSRRPLSARVDGRKFKGGRIPAGQGANAVEVFYERHSINEVRLSAPKEDDLLKAVTDLERWREVVIAWEQSDYKPTNIKGQLDWYREGIPERNGSAGNGTGFGLTAYAEKERKQHERDYGPDEELTPEKEQWIWEQKRKLAAQNPGV